MADVDKFISKLKDDDEPFGWGIKPEVVEQWKKQYEYRCDCEKCLLMWTSFEPLSKYGTDDWWMKYFGCTVIRKLSELCHMPRVGDVLSGDLK